MKKKIKGMSISKKALSVSVAVATALSLVGIAWASGSSGLYSSSSAGASSTGASGAPAPAVLATPAPAFPSSSSAFPSSSSSSSSSDDDSSTASIDIAAADYQVQLPDGTPVATVTLEVVSSQLNVLNISTEADWQLDGVDNDDDGHEAEVYFLNLDGDTRVKFKAELEYGQIKTVITVQTLAPSVAVAPTNFDVQVEGMVIATVTLEVVDGELRVVAVNSDWTYRVDDHEGDDDSSSDDSSEAEIYFFKDGTKVEFKAKLINGEIRVMTKVENEDRDEIENEDQDEIENEDNGFQYEIEDEDRDDDDQGKGRGGEDDDDDDRGGDHGEGDDD